MGLHDTENETFGKRSEWQLDTEGVNLLEVMNHDDVDFSRTTSNHLIEVIQVLGIEAGAYTRPLFSSTSAVSDAKYTPHTP